MIVVMSCLVAEKVEEMVGNLLGFLILKSNDPY